MKRKISERELAARAQKREKTKQSVKDFFEKKPKASNGDVARALGISKGTV